MRLPFSKPAVSRPELAFPSLDDSEKIIEAVASDPVAPPVGTPSPDPEIASDLSPNARTSALQLVGTIREILVGDQIRTLDTRFASLHNTIEGNVTGYVDGISNTLETIQSTLRDEIAEARGSIAEQAARHDHRSQEATAAITLSAERTLALEESFTTSIDSLRARRRPNCREPGINRGAA